MNPIMAFIDKKLNLGAEARRLYFGKNASKDRGVLEGYVRKLRSLAKSGEEADAESQNMSPGFETIVEDIAGGLRDFPGGITRFLGEAFDNKPKVFPGDSDTPRRRIEKHVRYEKTDRVGFAPLLGYHVAGAGGISVREYMTRGMKAAQASRRTWDKYGGFDMMPFNFQMAYLYPFIPDSHSRFWSLWALPDEDELPRLIETPLVDTIEELLRDGIIPLARTESGHLLKEFRAMAVQFVLFTTAMSYFFPRPDLYYNYASGVVNHPADLLSIWWGFEPFMMACATDPLKIKEACDLMAPGLVQAGATTCKLIGSKNILLGASRMSGSFVSRKMFDRLFADSFTAQVEMLHGQGYSIMFHLDNNYNSMLDYFLTLPRYCGILHLDQTDLYKAKKILHGHLCLMGNLHPGLAAAGSPSDVEAECERLIKEVGAGGGFILSNACETPINMHEENMLAMKNAVDRWGWY